MKTLETSIPFDGFYESIHSAQLDDEFEQLYGCDENGDPTNEDITDRYFEINWTAVHNYYAKQFAEWFAKTFDLPSLEFKELQSPREYNFTTDRIFCSISEDDVFKMAAAIDRAKLNARIEETFTSRSGFHSYYPNQLAKWPRDYRKWDHNQIGTLLEVYALAHDNAPNSDSIDWMFIEETSGNGLANYAIYEGEKAKPKEPEPVDPLSLGGT